MVRRSLRPKSYRYSPNCGSAGSTRHCGILTFTMIVPSTAMCGANSRSHSTNQPCRSCGTPPGTGGDTYWGLRSSCRERSCRRGSTVTGMVSGPWSRGKPLYQAASTRRFPPTSLSKLRQLVRATSDLASFRTPWAKFVLASSASLWKGNNCAASVGTLVCLETSTSLRSAGIRITMPSSTSSSAGGRVGSTSSRQHHIDIIDRARNLDAVNFALPRKVAP